MITSVFNPFTVLLLRKLSLSGTLHRYDFLTLSLSRRGRRTPRNLHAFLVVLAGSHLLACACVLKA